MTPQQARFAARLFTTKGFTQAKIAKLFGVDRTVITRSIQRAKSGDHMDVDVSGLSDSQKRIMKVVQAHTQKLVQEEFAKQEPEIRKAINEILPSVEHQISEQIERVDRVLARVDAEPHEGDPE